MATDKSARMLMVVVMALIGTQETLQAIGATPGAMVSLESSSRDRGTSGDRADCSSVGNLGERGNGDTGSQGQKEAADAGNGLPGN